jgi:ribosome-binding ATPase YchF (GTP1/OBG family)
VLADLDAVTKRVDRTQKNAKSGDKEAQAEVALLQKLEPHLNAGQDARTPSPRTPEEKALLKLFQLLTANPCCSPATSPSPISPRRKRTRSSRRSREYVRTHHDAAYVPISAKIEAELIRPAGGGGEGVS